MRRIDLRLKFGRARSGYGTVSPSRARAGWGSARAAGLVVLPFLLALFTSPAAGDPTLTVEVDRHEVRTGGVIILTVNLEGFSRGASEPQLPSTDGFDVYDAGRSTNISLINGHLSKRTTYTYQLLARKAGDYEFGPVVVEDDGTTYRSDTVSLTALPAGGVPTPGQQRGSRRETRASDTEQDRGVFARVEVDKRQVYQDEQLTLHFRLYQRPGVRVLDITDFVPPPTEGFWKEDLGPQQEYRVIIDGEEYHVRELSWALFPTTTGQRLIGEGSLVCMVPARSSRQRGFGDFFGRSLFDSQPLRLSTEPVTIDVRPLPREGRPDGFTGSVGDYRISASYEPAAAQQGEPLTLTVTVSGTGHIQTIGVPRWPAWDDFRVFDSGEAVSIRKSGERVSGEKTFTQVLVPNRSGRIQIPPIGFDFFDPQTGRYRRVETDPLQIPVAPPGTVPGGPGRRDVVALGEDILYIRTQLAGELGRPAEGLLEGGRWVHLLPVVILIGAAMIRRRRQAIEKDPVLARRSRALALAQKDLAGLRESDASGAAALAATAEEYVSDWLDVEARGLRRPELDRMLAAAGAGDEARGDLMELFAWADDVRFGAGDPALLPEQKRRLERLLPVLDKQLRDGLRARREVQS